VSIFSSSEDAFAENQSVRQPSPIFSADDGENEVPSLSTSPRQGARRRLHNESDHHARRQHPYKSADGVHKSKRSSGDAPKSREDRQREKAESERIARKTQGIIIKKMEGWVVQTGQASKLKELTGNNSKKSGLEHKKEDILMVYYELTQKDMQDRAEEVENLKRAHDEEMERLSRENEHMRHALTRLTQPQSSSTRDAQFSSPMRSNL
jgi:hypothetical protein